MKEGQHSTNPEIVAQRILRLKNHLKVSYWDLAALFQVRPLTCQRWASGKFAPRLVHQRTLTRLEKQHGIEGEING